MYLLDTIDYLQHGTKRQQRAHAVLTAHIIDKLQAFTPILAGTVPLQIDIEGSDLDILCYWENEADFVETIRDNFKDYDDFRLQQVIINNNQKTVLANFWCDGFEIEVFGQNIPSKQQMGYLHMVAEYKILTHFGEDFRQQIITIPILHF